MSRVLAGISAALSIFFVPWIFSFGAIIFFSGLFSWYFEALAAGLIIGLVADTAMWKMFGIFGSVVVAQELFKSYVNLDNKIAASVWLWVAGLIVFAAAFLILI